MRDMISKKHTETYINIEKKVDAYVEKLTLAQRLGLVQKPALPLGIDQWKQIEVKSEKLMGETCSICLDKFRIDS